MSDSKRKKKLTDQWTKREKLMKHDFLLDVRNERNILYKQKQKKNSIFNLRYLYIMSIPIRKNNALTTTNKNVYHFLKQNWDYKKIVAPKNFSFVEETNGVVAFINKLSDCFDNRKKVFIVLRNVENLTYDALVVLFNPVR